MFSQNRFIKLFNDVATSRWAAIILWLISFSLAVGIFVNIIIALIALGIMTFLLILFVLILFIITERTESGYVVTNSETHWQLADFEGRSARKTKKLTIRLTRATEAFHDYFGPEEVVVECRGITQGPNWAEGDRNRVLLCLGSTYPSGHILNFELDTLRIVIPSRESKHVEVPIDFATSKIKVQVSFPLIGDLPGRPAAEVLRRVKGETIPATSDKDTSSPNGSLGNLRVSSLPDRFISWEKISPAFGSTYVIKWSWATAPRK